MVRQGKATHGWRMLLYLFTLVDRLAGTHYLHAGNPSKWRRMDGIDQWEKEFRGSRNAGLNNFARYIHLTQSRNLVGSPFSLQLIFALYFLIIPFSFSSFLSLPFYFSLPFISLFSSPQVISHYVYILFAQHKHNVIILIINDIDCK